MDYLTAALADSLAAWKPKKACDHGCGALSQIVLELSAPAPVRCLRDSHRLRITNYLCRPCLRAVAPLLHVRQIDFAYASVQERTPAEATPGHRCDPIDDDDVLNAVLMAETANTLEDLFER